MCTYIHTSNIIKTEGENNRRVTRPVRALYRLPLHASLIFWLLQQSVATNGQGQISDRLIDTFFWHIHFYVLDTLSLKKKTKKEKEIPKFEEKEADGLRWHTAHAQFPIQLRVFSPPTLLLPFYMVHNVSLFNSWKRKRRKVSLVLFLTLLPSRLSRLPQKREKEKKKRYKEGKQQKGQVKTFCLRPGGMKPLACRHSSHFRWN